MCSAPMLVENRDAPTMGHVRLRPARKNPELLSLACERTASRKPIEILPTSPTKHTTQSNLVSEKLIPDSPPLVPDRRLRAPGRKTCHHPIVAIEIEI